jgi:TIR domain
MKVFISWSGEQSREIGEAFRNWLPGVLQAVKPYFSPDDIAKGSRWESDIAKELEACRLGLLILTAENLQAPWLVFEAGALSKTMDKSKVCPVLFGLEPADVKGPLVHFQGAKFEVEEMKRVVKMMNSELGAQGLEPTVLDEVFTMWWPKLEADVTKILKKPTKAKGSKRTDRDILEELLSIARQSAERHVGVQRADIPRRLIIDLLGGIEELINAAMILTHYESDSVFVSGSRSYIRRHSTLYLNLAMVMMRSK